MLGGMYDVGVRQAVPADYDRIVTVVDDWWGRPMTAGLSRLFLDHFFRSSLVAEVNDRLVGFLVGFLSPSQPTVAYIHYVAVDPDFRAKGLARELYTRFFDLARADARTVVQAITSPQNHRSIAFHTSMGFTVSAPYENHDGPGTTRVRFDRTL
ncbi:N-acetyltransferase [Acrocarpospora pleiomorpha]|uniref:N-acetyltransferase n=2 Tax=Acrocarpospora pleiomorpha TaxID=90975 RepID=A0A5M3XWP1_9ACTN|nr:N-acetyltransferase [Acrocarpospora pleiomorpha]